MVLGAIIKCYMAKVSIVAVLMVSCLLGISWVSQRAGIEKKLEKQIAAVWKNQPVSKSEIEQVSISEEEPDRHFFEICSDSALIGYAILSKSYGCRVGGCAVYSDNMDKSGSYDPFYYGIITGTDFSIKNVQVFEFYSEYGYQITHKKWLAQFIGTNGIGLQYGSDIDAISGATISAKSLIEDVDVACTELRQHMENSERQ